MSVAATSVNHFRSTAPTSPFPSGDSDYTVERGACPVKTVVDGVPEHGRKAEGCGIM